MSESFGESVSADVLEGDALADLELRADLAAGYNPRFGSAILADRIRTAALEDEDGAALESCAECGETLYRGRCYAVGSCRTAERRAVRASLIRGTAASARPAAWNLGGRVD